LAGEEAMRDIPCDFLFHLSDTPAGTNP